MNTQELKARFDELYQDMEHSKDVSKMKAFGVTFKAMFNKVAEVHPDIAEMAIEMLSMIEYNNFVTKEEALDVSTRFINDDTSISGASEPSKGAHWNMTLLKDLLTQKGFPLEAKPYYNWPALWLTVNMIYSDFAENIAEMTGSKENEKLAVSAYKMALKKLKDLDRPHFIREYFELDN